MAPVISIYPRNAYATPATMMNLNARHRVTLASLHNHHQRMLSMGANHAALRCKNCILMADS
jgi:hypothetical protein